MGAGLTTRLDETVDAVRGSRPIEWAGRLGLVARAVFYLLLAYLATRVALGDGGREADANGALRLVAAHPPGKVAIGLAAVGFAGFAVARLLGAWRDRDVSGWRRLSTAGQGLVYVVMAVATASFVFGRQSTGSEHQTKTMSAKVLGWPGGQVVLVAVGLVVVAVCAWQVKTALGEDYTDGMDLSGASARTRQVLHVVGPVGIIARALAFLPVGGLLVVAAVQYDAMKAHGLDGVLLQTAHHRWGLALIALTALGFVVFAVYTLLEARYRDLEAGD